MQYTMKTAAEASGIAYETVRYYCKIGLVPRVVRDENNYRVFDEHDVAWLKGLHRLRECGMSIKQMRTYMELCLRGAESIPEREEILLAQRKMVEHRISLLQEMLGFIAFKLEFYAKVRAGEVTYRSSLLAPLAGQTRNKPSWCENRPRSARADLPDATNIVPAWISQSPRRLVQRRRGGPVLRRRRPRCLRGRAGVRTHGRSQHPRLPAPALRRRRPMLSKTTSPFPRRTPVA